MITLAIDTSTPRGAVALLRDDKPLAEETFDRSQAGQNLFDTAAQAAFGEPTRAWRTSGCSPWDLAPARSPGFEPVSRRPRALALPRKLPIKGASSYDALALTALPKMPRDCPQLCVLGDARRDEIYFALYDRAGSPREGMPDRHARSRRRRDSSSDLVCQFRDRAIQE